MNRAIFEFSMDRLRIRGWKDVLAVILLYSALPLFMVASVLATKGFQPPEVSAKALYAVFEHPLFQMFLVFCIVSEAPASMRAIGDSDPMCLIFSRPITRLNYVMTKWVSGCLGALIVILSAALVYQAVVNLMHIDVALFTGYSVASIICNTIVHGALIVMLHCLPAIFGLFVLIMSHSLVNFGEMLARAPLSQWPWWARPITSLFVFSSDWLYDFVHLEIDVYSIFNSIHFSWLPIVTYVSNVVLLLWLGAWILSKREFFYGTE